MNYNYKNWSVAIVWKDFAVLETYLTAHLQLNHKSIFINF